jgi:hypothetical protein
MNTVRIYLPYGANLRFEGVERITSITPEYIAFRYQPRDEKGFAKKGKAEAIFCTRVICGYSMEES